MWEWTDFVDGPMTDVVSLRGRLGDVQKAEMRVRLRRVRLEKSEGASFRLLKQSVREAIERHSYDPDFLESGSR